MLIDWLGSASWIWLKIFRQDLRGPKWASFSLEKGRDLEAHVTSSKVRYKRNEGGGQVLGKIFIHLKQKAWECKALSQFLPEGVKGTLEAWRHFKQPSLDHGKLRPTPKSLCTESRKAERKQMCSFCCLQAGALILNLLKARPAMMVLLIATVTFIGLKDDSNSFWKENKSQIILGFRAALPGKTGKLCTQMCVF